MRKPIQMTSVLSFNVPEVKFWFSSLNCLYLYRQTYKILWSSIIAFLLYFIIYIHYTVIQLFLYLTSKWLNWKVLKLTRITTIPVLLK